MSLGRTSGGWWAADSYRPSLTAFVRDVDKARSDNQNPADTAPLPCGWSFDMAKSQLLIDPGVDEFPFYKASYGWVESINEATCNASASALCFQVIVKLPFRYGGSEAEPLRWAFARMNAFSSKCIFRWVSSTGNSSAFPNTLSAETHPHQPRKSIRSCRGWRCGEGLVKPDGFGLQVRKPSCSEAYLLPRMARRFHPKLCRGGLTARPRCFVQAATDGL